jgi:8-hydroxy-5-deazaflavin:NADPH oxidoreductase
MNTTLSVLLLFLVGLPFPLAAQDRPVVAMIGTGNVGSALGPKLAELGYTVIYGSRSPESAAVRALVARSGRSASARNPRDAAERAAIVILGVPGDALEDVSRDLGDVTGKVLLEMSGAPKRIAQDGYLEITSDSANAERLQSWHPEARVVRMAIPTSILFSHPNALGIPPTVMIAGNDPRAKEAVARLIFDMGLDPWDAGPLRYTRLIDAMGLLTLVPLQQRRGEGVEVKLLRNSVMPCLFDVVDAFGFGKPYDLDSLARFPTREAQVSCDAWARRLGMPARK